jgi:hypothetical protein
LEWFLPSNGRTVEGNERPSSSARLGRPETERSVNPRAIHEKKRMVSVSTKPEAQLNFWSDRIVMRSGIVPLAMAVFAWGCCTAPAGQFKALADSASQLSTADQQAYNQSVEVERSWVIITQKSGDLTPHSFDLGSAFDAQAGERPLGEKDLGARLEANGVVLTVISNYLSALSSFASNDFQSNLDKSATKLAGSVKSLSNLSQPWAKEAGQSSGVLATVVDGLGHAYIEYERIGTLKRAMASAQEPLERLADFVMTNDSVVRETLTSMERYYLQDANLLRPPAPSAHRLAFDAYIAQSIGQFDDVQKTLTGLDKAVANVPKAHQELAQGMCTANPNVDNLKSLIAEAERLSKFYKSVK